MAKILISSLGTGNKREGNYAKAIYEINSKKYETTFISKALCEHFCVDKLFLVGTKKSIWDSAYENFGGKDNSVLDSLYTKQENGDLELSDLDIVLSEMEKKLKNIGSKCFLIDYGKNEQELWGNFDIFLKMAEHISNGDEILLDITHSFRSLSLMSFVMLEFAKTISGKNFTISGVYYGMFEAKDENGITPVVDIKILFDLLEWIKAIDSLNNYGKLDKLANLTDNKDLNNFDNSLSMSNLMSIQNSIKRLSEHDIFRNTDNKIATLLSPQITKFIKKLNKENMFEFQLELAEWFCEKRNFALAYLALAESIISKMSDNAEGKEAREKAKEELKQAGKNENSRNASNKHLSPRGLLAKKYFSINETRNNIAHQQKGDRGVNDEIKNLEQFIEEIKELYKKL